VAKCAWQTVLRKLLRLEETADPLGTLPGIDARMLGIVDAALQDRDPGTRKQLGTFLSIIRWTPVVRFGRPLDRLAPERRDATLRWFQDCPVGVLRKGFWGLKTLVFMGYYGRPECWAEIGYAPEFDGRAGVRGA